MSQPEAIASPRLTRRTCLKAGLGLAALAAQGPWPTILRAEAARRPNIVFLLADDQRFDALGCMGNREIKTPHVDRLAAEGMLFTDHYDTSPICMASRATVMTGMYEYRHGCNFSRGSLARDMFLRSYPVLLRQAGYRTGFAGKFNMPITPQTSAAQPDNYDTLPVDQFDWFGGWPSQGFYETAKNKYMAPYAGKYPHVSRALGAAACDFIKGSAAQGKPFCLSISFKAPHHPYTPDPLDRGLYEGVTFSKPANWGREVAKHLPEQARRSRMFQQEFQQWSTEAGFQESLRLYYQLVNGNDVAVGMIREALQREGVADNTVIVYTSDNGWMPGDHGMGGKVFPYEGAARAPLIVYDPRHPTAHGRRCAALTGNIDMAPTILDMAGLPIPGNMDGKSLVPLLAAPERQIRESLLLINAWPWSAESLVLSVATPEWKYMYWFYGDATMEPAEELYDMRKDRIEMVNEARNPEKQAVLERMRALYDDALARARTACVQGNKYPEFLESADRRVPWSAKKWTAPVFRAAAVGPAKRKQK
ncbi:MAG: sulfatase [Phycisphaerae bacterium]|nr:sulfatase [Phycisphaerae bacterium]